MKRVFWSAVLGGILLQSTAQGDWKNMLDSATKAIGGQQGLTTSALSNSEIAAGLREALANGVRTAVETLGQTDGFWRNELVRIGMPDSVEKVADAVRKFGGASYVDEFELTMNRAAEQAVPAAADIFADAVSQMSIEDAQQILAGPDDAATKYFRRTAGDRLATSFRPIVEGATAKTGVTSAYKQMVGQAGPVAGMLGGASDLDGYVTEQAVDGLFAMIAVEEKRIRENPAARTSELLQRVFGSR